MLSPQHLSCLTCTSLFHIYPSPHTAGCVGLAGAGFLPPPPPTSGTNSFARGAVWAGRGAAPVPQLMKGQWVASQKFHPTASTHNSTSAASISAPGASREGATSTLTPHRAVADPHFMPSAQLWPSPSSSPASGLG